MNLKRHKFSILVLVLLGIICLATYLAHNKHNEKIDEISTYSLQLAGKNIALSKSNPILNLRLEQVDWSNLASVSFLYKNANKLVRQSIDQFEVFAESSTNHAVFNTTVIDFDFWRSIRDKMGSQLSLYIKVTDKDGVTYFASCKTSYDKNTFTERILNSSFLNATKVSIEDIDVKGDFYKERFGVRLPLYDIGDDITPVYLSNEGALHSGDLEIKIETKYKDSLHVLVKAENGNLNKLSFSKDDKIVLNDLLQFHVEESTIYFCHGDPMKENRKLGVLVISDKQRLLAIQPTFLENSIGLALNDVSFIHLAYEAADLKFVWGDIQLTLAKNENGDYFAKKRIGKSKWNNTHLKKPNLLIGKRLLMDSLSFNISFATQNLDTMNKVVVENLGDDSTKYPYNINLPDTLSVIPKSKQKSVIRIEDIQNDNIAEANISLEIEIFDDSPKRKLKKYQFHWGAIDTTLTQKIKTQQFRESISLPLTKFKSLFSKEPVLTSSVEGVVYEFSYKILHLRAGELMNSTLVKSNIKDAAIFLNSIKEVDFIDQVKVGDEITLRSFISPEFSEKDEIRLDIVIKKDPPKELSDSIEDKNIFLEWGTRKFKTTQLGDQSRKKRVQDQVIDKNHLLDIIEKKLILNKYGKKERIIHAEWFINDEKFGKNPCEKEQDWKQCFASHLKSVRSGDFVSIFMRTSKGYGAICQFHIDYAISDAIIGFGNTEFDSLLFKYSKQTYTKPFTPKYNYEFSWGKAKVPLVLKGNPRVYGGEASILLEDLKNVLENKIQINSSDGEVISVRHAYMFIRKIILPGEQKKFKGYDFDCENLDCAMDAETALTVLEEIEGNVFSVRVFIDEHSPSEEGIKVSFVDLIVEDDSKAWRPKRWVAHNKNTDLFEFQFVYQEKEKTLVKLDKQNEKYLWIVEKYTNDPTVELIDLPGFKTPQRAIYTKYDWGNHESIRTTEVLSRNYTNGYALFDYHDLGSKELKLYWKGYESLYGAQSYCSEDFVCSDGGLELTVGNQEISIIRGDLIILPEEGAGTKFVFDDINCAEIANAIQDLPNRSSIFFENLIVKGDNGQPVRLPLKFAYHIE